MRRIGYGIAALAAVSMLVASPAMAHPKDPKPTNPTITVVSSAVAAPFNLEVNSKAVLVADGFQNLVGSVGSDGVIKTLAADQPGASGIATSRNGKLMAFATTETDMGTFNNTASGLNIWGHGKKIYADTLAYETKHNPDKVFTYGVKNPSQCVSDALEAAGVPASYTGAIDSHAYSVVAYGDGWLVADAGANVLWRVDARGRVKVAALLPPQPHKITADQAAALGLPDCLVGVTYAFESVPTDVEVGKNGTVYVSTLPGGPETPELGARGSVYKVNVNSGKATRVATGFLGATNLALASNGDIYVAEFFAGRIALLRDGKISTFVELPGALSVEVNGSTLWAGTMGPFGSDEPGTIVKITKGRK